MDPASAVLLTTGLARLLTVAIQSGIELKQIFAEARAQSGLPPERWDAIMAKLAEGESWIEAEIARRNAQPE